MGTQWNLNTRSEICEVYENMIMVDFLNGQPIGIYRFEGAFANMNKQKQMSQKLAVKVENNSLKFGSASISFQRTLRIPDDGKTYPLPPSFGYFPVHKIDDFMDKVPADWRAHGGVFIPMYQREVSAMQRSFMDSLQSFLFCILLMRHVVLLHVL